jgi:hypothetical protein
MRAIKITRRSSIHKYGKSHCRNTKLYPTLPFLPKTTSLKQIKQEIPIDMIICLLQIQFAQYPGFPQSKKTIQTIAISIESKIWRPTIKASCELEIIFSKIDINLVARSLDMILHTPPTNRQKIL